MKILRKTETYHPCHLFSGSCTVAVCQMTSTSEVERNVQICHDLIKKAAEEANAKAQALEYCIEEQKQANFSIFRWFSCRNALITWLKAAN